MKNATYPTQNVSQLQRQIKAQQEEIAQLHRLMEKKEAQWEAAKQSLFEQFRLALERQFGPSTEKYRVDQRDLLINEAEVAVDEEDSDASACDAVADDAMSETASPPKRRTRGGRVALPPELPRVEVVHELPDNACHCRAKRASALLQCRPNCCPRAMPAPRCSPISQRLNTRTRYRFIDRARSLPAMALRSPVIPWHAGWCRWENGSPL